MAKAKQRCTKTRVSSWAFRVSRPVTVLLGKQLAQWTLSLGNCDPFSPPWAVLVPGTTALVLEIRPRICQSSSILNLFILNSHRQECLQNKLPLSFLTNTKRKCVPSVKQQHFPFRTLHLRSRSSVFLALFISLVTGHPTLAGLRQ